MWEGREGGGGSCESAMLQITHCHVSSRGKVLQLLLINHQVGFELGSDMLKSGMGEEIIQEPYFMSALLQKSGRQRLHGFHVTMSQLCAATNGYDQIPRILFSVSLASRGMLYLHV